ncbi:MAG: peroxiredoxin [Candidatus Micrarchaeota archaeon]|nr:MAG: peroxiredoxin [Candidatus Micrarchaeota archaeon]
MIEIEELSPRFKAKVYYPKQDKIEEIEIPQRGVWNILTFYPGDFTFVCATDIEELQKKYEEFKKEGAEIFAISTDSIYSHKAWANSSPRVSKSTIPLVEDFKKEISEALGVLNRKTGAARRSVAIVDPEGRLQYISIFNDSLGKDVEHIYVAFKALKYIHEHPTDEQGHVCVIPANWRPGKEVLKIDTVKDIGKL